MASAGHVPSGLRGIRSDFAHFCRVHGATGFRARLRLLLASRAFWGLAIYRFGRWVYERPRHPLTLAARALYVLLFEAGRLLTKTSLSVRSRIESEVWIAPRGEVFISLGEPDEILDLSNGMDRSGQRVLRWTYTSERLVLYFQDQTGFGRYRLTPSSRAEFQRVLARVRRSER